jgi:uncharacterized protein (TIGR03437 family)
MEPEGYSGDGGPANSAQLSSPRGLAVDASGNIYIADTGSSVIRKVSASGIISTVGGNGMQGLSGDGGPATSASLSAPTGVAVDVSGSLFIADRNNSRIRKVSAGSITTVAGSGDPGVFFDNAGFAGDGGPATSASLGIPDGVAVDTSGNLFIADTYNNRIRMVSAGGLISTVAGSGAYNEYQYNGCCEIDLGTGDGGPATSATLDNPFGVAVDPSGNVFISDTYDFAIREALAQTAPSSVPHAPVLNTGGIVNASFNSGALPASPGSLISIFGLNLGTSAQGAVADSSGRLPLSLAGASVQFGAFSAPLLYVSPTQINAQVPFELEPRTYPVTVTTAVAASNPIDLTITATSPGMFTGAVVNNTTGAVINAANPLHPGDVVVVYCTGLGAVSPGVATGQLAPDNPISFTTASPTVTIGGLPVQVVNSVSSPGFVGLYQIGLIIPDGLPQGAQPLVMTSGGVVASPLQVVSAPSTNPQYCADVSGTWSVTEAGNLAETIASVAETDSQTIPYSGQGTIDIVQSGCSISYTTTGLLAQDQASALTRTGTVAGTAVSLQGPLALSSQTTPGFTITQITQNQFQSSGQVTGALLTTSDSGAFVGSGTYSLSGQTGSFTLTYDVSGSSTLIRPGVGPIAKVAPAALAFQSLEGGAAPSQSFQIVGTAGISWQATVTTSSGGGWLSVSPASGQIPVSPVVTVNPGTLGLGTHYGNIVIQAQSASLSSSGTIGVTLTITAASGPGIIMTVAGSGPVGTLQGGFSGDGGLATAAALYSPNSVAVDTSGNIFIADTGNNRVRKVSANNGIITTIAGNGTQGSSGDGGPATAAELNTPTGVAVDASGNIFIADSLNIRIRKVSPSGIITTYAGNGICCGFSGDGGPATLAELNNADGIAVDASGNLFIADQRNSRIRSVSAATGIITTVAGNGSNGFSGDGGPATTAALYYPTDLTVDASGNLFIADCYNGRVRKVSASGIITTVAGTGISSGSPSGIGGLATSANLVYVYHVAVDPSGNLFIPVGNQIWYVSASSGIVTNVAGNGTPYCGSNNCFTGDGGLAISAALDGPAGLSLDAAGDLFIADSGNERIREVFQAGAPAAPASAKPAGRIRVGFTASPGSTVTGNGVISLESGSSPRR